MNLNFRICSWLLAAGCIFVALPASFAQENQDPPVTTIAPLDTTNTELNFRLRLSNLEIGRMRFTHALEGIDYHISLDLHTIGIADAILPLSILAESYGFGNPYLAYNAEYMQISIAQSETTELRELFLREGKPFAQSAEPELHPALDLALYQNATDPVTALGYVLRPQTHARLCQIYIRVSDGYQAGRLVLGEPSLRDDGRTECRGGYERIEGYSEAAMNKPVTYFTAIYRQETKNEFVIDRLIAGTAFGNVSLIRERVDIAYQETDEIIITEDVPPPNQ